MINLPRHCTPRLTVAQVADSYLHPYSTLPHHQKAIARGWASVKLVSVPIELGHIDIVQAAAMLPDGDVLYTPKGVTMVVADAVRMYAYIRRHAISRYGDGDGVALIRLWYKTMNEVRV